MHLHYVFAARIFMRYRGCVFANDHFWSIRSFMRLNVNVLWLT